jgi:hypothetical protein
MVQAARGCVAVAHVAFAEHSAIKDGILFVDPIVGVSMLFTQQHTPFLIPTTTF